MIKVCKRFCNTGLSSSSCLFLILCFLRSPIRYRNYNFAFPISLPDLFYTVFCFISRNSIRVKEVSPSLRFFIRLLREPIGYYALYLFISYKIFISTSSSSFDITSAWRLSHSRSHAREGEREKERSQDWRHLLKHRTGTTDDTVYSEEKIRLVAKR